MKPKLVLVLFVILILLFIVSVGVGARSEREGGAVVKPNFDGQWAQSLRERMTKKLKSRDLRLDDGSDADCRVQEDHLEVPVGADCAFVIVAANNTTRRLRLSLVQGDELKLTLEQEGALTIDNEPLFAGEGAKSFDVYRNEEDGTLSMMACLVDDADAPQICRVSLE